MGKPGDLGDYPADKISVSSDPSAKYHGS